MIKNNKRRLLISSLIILLPMLFGLAVWNCLPEQMVTHWGAGGEADGWSSRYFAVFATPVFILFVHWLCVVCTTLDPKSKNQNSKILSIVLWLCPIISLFVGIMVYAAAFGRELEPWFIVSLLLGLVFVIIGNYLPKCRQNFTIGIRVKWTLESEENWSATHRFCGAVWVIGGVLTMACAFLPKSISPFALFALLLAIIVLPLVYSYHFAMTRRGK